jgi:hypothetical protein
MGHFGEFYDENNDYEDKNLYLRKKMSQVILSVYSEKSLRELNALSDESLRGLYAQACRKLKYNESEEKFEDRRQY